MVRKPDPKNLELLRGMAREEQMGARITMRVGPWSIFVLISALQLSCRHPGVSADMKSYMRVLVDGLAERMPRDLQPLINSGWQPDHDVTIAPIVE